MEYPGAPNVFTFALCYECFIKDKKSYLELKIAATSGNAIYDESIQCPLSDTEYKVFFIAANGFQFCFVNEKCEFLCVKTLSFIL